MNPDTDRKQEAAQFVAATQKPAKRLRIQKLEERIAPSKGGKGTHNCSGGGGGSSASSGFSSGISTIY